MKRALPLCFFVLLLVCSFAQNRGFVFSNSLADAKGKEKRIALVIGNSSYSKTGQTLKNPVNDANLMSTTLEKLGFKVIKKLNTTKIEMENALRAFEKQLPDYNVVLVYYAGHGIVGSNRDYLIPTDATVESPEDIKYDCIPVESITALFNQYPDKTNILILDACRNNPYRTWARSAASGFVKIEPSSGTIIGFATGEGSTASDGNGDNGLYTKVLAEEMQKPQQIEFVFKNTRKKVYDLSNHAQLPQDWNQLMGDFWFQSPSNKDGGSEEIKANITENKVIAPVKEEKKTDLSEHIDLETDMVMVTGGIFTMGCTDEQGSDCYDNEKPAHQVTLKTFYISKYNITQAQWRAIMGSELSGFKGCNNCPIEKVSWNDVQEFITKLNAKTGRNYRLPTEAEWEYAARGGSQSRGYKYSGSNSIDEVAWNSNNSGSKTHPVGQKQANELGLYDMSGNVFQWCVDWYDNYKRSRTTNPQGPSTGNGRAVRGGSWYDDARYCRISARSHYTSGTRDPDVGFRLAHD